MLGHFLHKPYYVLGGESGAPEKLHADAGASFEGASRPYSYWQRVRLRSAGLLPQQTVCAMMVTLSLLWHYSGEVTCGSVGGFHPLKEVVFGDPEGSAPLRHVHV